MKAVTGRAPSSSTPPNATSISFSITSRPFERKVMWPRWTPPPEMVERDANAAKWKDGMPGGPDNPLGARALYLFQNGRDTLYRLHGTNAPQSIGKAMSSGCIRMINEDVIELYNRSPVGSRVVVLAQGL
jgi:lipoprotein-anchoring transpeptidase ErfK/SrfK